MSDTLLWNQGAEETVTVHTVPAEEGNALLYVSRGLGNSGIPLRFANHPEVILAVLEAQ